jgi:pimeloyl-ACP methyl ester carboxylesterase
MIATTASEFRSMHRTLRTEVLEIGYLEFGPAAGAPVVLLHGWPSDVLDWRDIAPSLAESGFRVLVPWLRGFGPTRLLSEATPRSGQQGALGADLRDFIDALGLAPALLAGYDWGGRAACVVCALWPDRVRGLVTINGYNIQDIAQAQQPGPVEQELRYWYQWYFHTARGGAGLERNRREIARLLWRRWSPNWAFDDATLDATAASFDNPDFVAVTLHSYRHRYGAVAGDPAYDEVERQLAQQPRIEVPAIVLQGGADGVTPPELAGAYATHFGPRCEHRLVARAGHFLPREDPRAVVDALLALGG